MKVSLPSSGPGVDIGSPPLAGSNSYNSATGVYTVSGCGSDIWNTSDQFHYLYSSISGNFDVTCKVLSLSGGTDPWRKIGIMARNSTDPGSAFEFACLSAGNGTVFPWRDSNGGLAARDSTSGPGNIPAQGRWLRLVRSGNTFTVYTELDGDANWTLIDQAHTPSTPLNTSRLIGLAVCSHNSSVLTTATFSNVGFLTSGLNLPNSNFSLSQSGGLNVDYALASTLGSLDLSGTATTLSLSGVSSQTSFNNLSAEAGSVAAISNSSGNMTAIALRGTTTVNAGATLTVAGADRRRQCRHLPGQVRFRGPGPHRHASLHGSDNGQPGQTGRRWLADQFGRHGQQRRHAERHGQPAECHGQRRRATCPRRFAGHIERQRQLDLGIGSGAGL